MDQNSDVEPAASPEAGSIGRRAGRGLRWSLLGNLGTKVSTFAMGLVLARLLAPEDFGLYAVALAATQFVMHVNDVGIIAATVQWRGRLADMAPTATVMATVFSCVIYAIFWVIAPYYADLAGSPEATPVIRLLTSIILIDGVTAVRSAALLRDFAQDKLTMANMVGSLLNAALAIPLAMAGAGAFSFAWGQFANTAIIGVLVWFAAKLPNRVGFDREVAVKLLRFGAPLALGLGIESVLMNADYVIIGDLLGPDAVGYYLLAFNVSNWVPGVIGTAIRYVSIAGFSRLAEQTSDVLSRGVQRSVPLLITGVTPIAVVMMTLAHPIITFLYGAEWAMSAGVLRFLAVLMTVRMLTALAFDILTSMGVTRSTVWLNLGWCVALLPVLWVAVRLDGIRGAAMGHAVVAVLVALPLAVWMLHRQGVRLGPILPAMRRPLLGGVVVAAVTLPLAYLTRENSFVQLCVAGGLGMIAYALVVPPWALLKQFGGRMGRLIPARTR
ncbi:MAG TPA: oligosaccharide flippase family protein [Thermopolyspora sp.]